ncbi:hypothetical protein [Micromonospora okii]|uniref:hypothetical protein n=1 Tax=Micromonospora okii TaxID=1182970 RepID=UPI001E507412|nr:hypothetical protein [Micromonospora okii]
MSQNPSSRRLHAQVAAHTRWSRESDRKAATGKARAAFIDRFEREVDPDGVLPPEERALRAESAKKAYFVRLAIKSAAARARRKGAA